MAAGVLVMIVGSLAFAEDDLADIPPMFHERGNRLGPEGLRQSWVVGPDRFGNTFAYDRYRNLLLVVYPRTAYDPKNPLTEDRRLTLTAHPEGVRISVALEDQPVEYILPDQRDVVYFVAPNASLLRVPVAAALGQEPHGLPVDIYHRGVVSFALAAAKDIEPEVARLLLKWRDASLANRNGNEQSGEESASNVVVEDHGAE